LVKELSQAIVTAVEILGKELDVNYQINVYKKDETLVIYRTGRKYVNDGLLPRNEVCKNILFNLLV
jgi:hypothetical protein